MTKTAFDKKIEEDDHLLTAQEWLDEVKHGSFIDYDGYGYLSNGTSKSSDTISPSKAEELPSDVTHIVWINR